ncbi:hypothetical protein E3O06_05095 [Cryobacterium glaciale]|uniref:Uncharacterized protein n=1 Tax=Cryobacterium glaciale TaxID=1259145 RepID=A0A4R8V1H0_9MICO|nr:hypothetical protein [Cryobacterium glaciale]TFB75214.1 hypothetical protein E3O06_05095 [Cryobacterium glaciale]
MTTTVKDLLALVPSLNIDGEPYTFEAKGKTLVGQWDIVSAVSLYPTEAAAIDKKYKIIVSFDEKDGTYDYTEKQTSTSVSVNGGGLSFGTSTSSGKSSSKQASFEFGGINKTKNGVSPVLAYSFSTSQIKTPLFAFLEQNGWTKKKGFFGRLFSK